MVKPLKKRERGIALILVMCIVALIVAITLELNRASRLQVYEAANIRDGVTLQYVAKSGVYIGRSALKEDDALVDSFLDDWAKAQELSLQSESLFDSGFFELKISDESGKIPVNKLTVENNFNDSIREIFIRLLTLPDFGLNEEAANDIVDAIKDWIDGDDEITGFGAENNWYKGLDTPYACKNAPLDCVDELLMVKGITRGILYGVEGRMGIAPYLSVFGTGKININTAPLPVLRAMSGEITDEMALDMDAYRRSEDNKGELSNPSWYKNITGMTDIHIDPDVLSVKSSVFEIQSTGRRGNMMRTITAIVERGESAGKMPVISMWKVN